MVLSSYHKKLGFTRLEQVLSAPKGWKQKKIVLVANGKRPALIRFGLRGMVDYTMHKDPKRRKNYLARSAGIRDKNGKLTMNNKLSANYWSRTKLW